MRFMMLVKSSEAAGPPPQALMDAITESAERLSRDGILIEAGGLAPTAMSTCVRLSGGRVAVIDGPFTEAKEVVGGYAVHELKSKEEAVESAVWFMNLHKEHWPGWEGEVEIRQIFGPEEFATQAAQQQS
jgi:hypothetical protein